MQKSGGARSGSFSIPWTAACMSFFQVKWNRYFVVFRMLQANIAIFCH
jgi:hypothetical protein